MFESLNDLSNSVSQFAITFSQDFFTVSENNSNGMDNFWGKLMQKSLKFNIWQKSFITLDILYGKLK